MGVESGDLDDQIFPNKLKYELRWEVSQMVFFRSLLGKFGAALKTIYLFGCLFDRVESWERYLFS